MLWQAASFTQHQPEEKISGVSENNQLKDVIYCLFSDKDIHNGLLYHREVTYCGMWELWYLFGWLGLPPYRFG